MVAAQFHPEKSGTVGLAMIHSFLKRQGQIAGEATDSPLTLADYASLPKTVLAKRVIACLDVRTNDEGDLVVTKGDQYDVRESSSSSEGRCLASNSHLTLLSIREYWFDFVVLLTIIGNQSTKNNQYMY